MCQSLFFNKTAKLFPFEKLKSREKITLVEKEELVSSKSDVKCCNHFFPNIVKNLEIPKYVDDDALHLNLSNHPISNLILKYRKHPSINAIRLSRYQTASFRSSRRRCSVREGVLRNFAKFTGKHLCQSLFFNFIKKRLWHRCFPVNFPKFLRTENLQETASDLSIFHA